MMAEKCENRRPNQLAEKADNLKSNTDDLEKDIRDLR
jgi:hypothetical protein